MQCFLYSITCDYLFCLQTWNYYYDEHQERFEVLDGKESNDSSPYTEDSAYMFDAIWTAALALNKTKPRLEKLNLTFANYSYDDENGKIISDIIYEEAVKVKFFGLTVSVQLANISNVLATHSIHTHSI